MSVSGRPSTSFFGGSVSREVRLGPRRVLSQKQYNPADFHEGNESVGGSTRKRGKTAIDEANSILFTLVMLRTGMQQNVAAAPFGLSNSTAGGVFVT